MKNILVIIKTTILIMAISFTQAQNGKTVLIKTTYGDIKVKLYDETPQHRDNFLKLAKEGFYDSTLFHRVIKDFMIQGGDPNSKNATAGQQLGMGAPGYLIPAEFNDKFFHKKGVLSAARQSDNVNPQKKSSGSQFYIVQGRVFNAEELQQMEYGITNQRLQQFFPKFISKPENAELGLKLDSLQKSGNKAALDMLTKDLVQMMFKSPDFVPFKFTEDQKEAYTTIGGAPHLDGEYTIFGEVVEGLEVIDKIAAVETDKNDRPTTDIVISMQVMDE